MHGCYCLGDDNHPVDLLSAICRDSNVALYPISLTIDCRGCVEDEHTDLQNDASAVADTMADYANKIQKPVMNCGYINTKGRELWFDLIRRGNRGPTLALLLTLLPNLETLQCYQYTAGATHFKQIVRHITKPCGRKAFKMHKKDAKILTKLREVQLGGYEYNNDGNDHFVKDFNLATYIAKLPSMRTIYANPAKNLFVQNP